MAAVIEVRDLTRTYKTTTGTIRRKPLSVEAVRGISFEVADGELFGLLGPNGGFHKSSSPRRETGALGAPAFSAAPPHRGGSRELRAKTLPQPERRPERLVGKPRADPKRQWQHETRRQAKRVRLKTSRGSALDGQAGGE